MQQVKPSAAAASVRIVLRVPMSGTRLNGRTDVRREYAAVSGKVWVCAALAAMLQIGQE